MSYREGDWIIDKIHGLTGVVLRVFSDGVSARFGTMTAIRSNHNIELAPLDIRNDDLLVMQHLAVDTGDYDWFCKIGERMGAEMHGSIGEC
ncbi:hypothetical protein J7E63_13035 [Bacillus sp. ISL-75]|uniref:hypothetical protein n=1 Tax=Bacillus sp. ISL-75 TaxID=2819137 RepID=UPI001BEAA994|nr:hypothetical protein [Bacillus sp. ISL-75]MBT2727864.1 hypothetical protein [Bacillus sp. ISL-75]